MKINNITRIENMKQTIKLRESELKQMIVESVKRVLKENGIKNKLMITENIGGFEMDKLFDEYDTDTISVSDFGITYQGTAVDYIHRGNDGRISIWSGNPDTDKYAEELLPDKTAKRKILELIWEYLS